MARAPSLSLIVLILSFSHLICLNAAPITRTKNLMHGYQRHQDTGDILENTEEIIMEKNIVGRMDIEVNDYPGSGANNRHTPRTEPWRSGCVDC